MGGLGIDPTVVPAFILAMVLIELTPGPNLAYLALLSASRGWRAGLLAVAGVTVGLSAYLFITYFGLTQTPLHSEAGLNILRWAGIAYLLWLAWETVRGSAASSADPNPARSPFIRGLIANLLNAKAALFYLALLPGFIKPAAGPVGAQILIFGIGHILISVLIHSAVVFGAASLASRLPPRGALVFRLVLAAGLVAAAFWLIAIPLSPGSAR
ncbi:MAG: LysE family translocator [Brevundimonas sp.]|uniref:LysE family translocator n=1 Tax=Brevundimonas sp. TaxID=1871086 RepID=UPI002726749E|nr:LysE family translocator [Brevundimonas sp.]MDO9587292.1 LysE family translocator [Brevundimonas sp.]MDP3658166.1 LysE family translocator [Brevundimonas sp.]MDZ4110629.1 LysE family translocator [Brevundimonas sp.]